MFLCATTGEPRGVRTRTNDVPDGQERIVRRSRMGVVLGVEGADGVRKRVDMAGVSTVG